MNKTELIQFLKSQNFIPSKKMGQNFLLSDNVKNNIVSSAKLSKEDYVLEIGPGFGAITTKIIPHVNKMIAVELDKRVHAYLKENIKDENFEVVNDDILKVDIDALLKLNNFNNVKVVANLPYSISSKIIMQLLKCENINEIYILVQKEMAERISAKYNTKDYNAFSALINMFSDTKKLFTVQPKDFYPVPAVDSCFIRITKNNKFGVELDSISSFLKKCFSSKRKKVINNLLNFYDKDIIIEYLTKNNIDLNIRAEALNLEQLVGLYENLKL